MINLGNALARANFVVMYQWSPAMGISKKIDPAEPGNLVSGFRFLEQQEYVDHERVGLGWFSVGASFALVAAADDKIRDRVAREAGKAPRSTVEPAALEHTEKNSAFSFSDEGTGAPS